MFLTLLLPVIKGIIRPVFCEMMMMVVLGGLFDLNDTLIYCTVTIVICYLGHHCIASVWCHAVLQCTAGVSVTIYFLVHSCSPLHCMEYTTQNAINFVSSIENTPLAGSSTICGIAYPVTTNSVYICTVQYCTQVVMSYQS